MVPRSSATFSLALPRSPEAKKAVEGIIAAGLGRAPPKRQSLLALPEDRPTPRALAVDSIPPSQAASARPNHEAHRDTDTVRSDRRGALRVGVGHADDHQHKT